MSRRIHSFLTCLFFMSQVMFLPSLAHGQNAPQPPPETPPSNAGTLFLSKLADNPDAIQEAQSAEPLTELAPLTEKGHPEPIPELAPLSDKSRSQPIPESAFFSEKGRPENRELEDCYASRQTAMQRPIDQWKKPNGSPDWPPNDGLFKNATIKVLKKGTIVSRFGSTRGYFAAPAGTPLAMRSMFPGPLDPSLMNLYELLEDIPVEDGLIAPWFNQPGCGEQYKFSQSFEDLLTGKNVYGNPKLKWIGRGQ